MSRKILVCLSLIIVLGACAVHPPREIAEEPRGEEARIRQALHELITAYEKKDPVRFGEHISSTYFGDKARLEIRIRRDFSALHDISIEPTITSIVADGMGRVFVEMDFRRSHTLLAGSERITKTGRTSLIFRLEEGRYRLTSQRPPLFGLH